MDTDLKSLVQSSLPKEILSVANVSTDESRNYIKNLLLKTLPSTDSKNLNTELKWNFLLDKHSLNKKKTLQKKKTFLTRKQRKKLNLLTLPKDGWNYASLQTLRDMWKKYMKENLDSVSKAPLFSQQDWSSFSNIVAKSELIGAEITVIKSKVPNQVSMSGTVILETKMTFQIITKESKLKVIIKNNAVFAFHLENMKFIVYGKYIATRPTERSVKKIKGIMVPDL